MLENIYSEKLTWREKYLFNWSSICRFYFGGNKFDFDILYLMDYFCNQFKQIQLINIFYYL